MFAGIELIIDIGNHIISKTFGEHAKSYSEIIEMLGKKEIVPKSFADDNKTMAKFRNLVAHDYDKLTPEGIYSNLQKAPNVFRQFAKYFIEFMEKQVK